MVKPSWHSTERYESARECIEAQIKKYGIYECYYDFRDNGGCCSQVIDAWDSTRANPTEMIDIAVERFNKFGEVVFEGLGTNTDGRGASIQCWDENATGSKY